MTAPGPPAPGRRLLFLLFLALIATPVSAARLPDWAVTVAQSAPEIPAGVPRTPSRVLLAETWVAVQPDGSRKILRRFAAQALSVDTDRISTGVFAFSDQTKVTASRAWHLPPGDRARRDRSEPVDIAVGDAFLTGQKARAVLVAGVRKGSLIFYEFEAVEKPYLLDDFHFFYEAAPVALDRYVLETPPGWQVRSSWLRKQGPEPVLAGNRRTWEIRDLSAPSEEPLAAADFDSAPMLVVSLKPPSGSSTVAPEFGSWPAASTWYDTLAGPSRQLTPELREAARKAGCAGEEPLEERILKCARWVRDRVRYQAVDLGMGGYRPREAGQVLANLYGDCKDKGTLYQALLASAGVPSYPLLVHATARDTVTEELPVWAFNHFVVGVALPAAEEVPAGLRPVVADAGDLGKLLIVDTTDEHTAVGSLSSALAGKKALVVAGDRGRLITLPPPDPATHRIDRHFEVTVEGDHSLQVVQVTRWFGDPAAQARAEEAGSSRERREECERGLLHRWPEAAVTGYQTEPESADGAFVETVHYRRGPLAGAAARVELFPVAPDDLDQISLGRRTVPVVYPHPLTIHYRAELRGLPAGSALPGDRQVQGAGWSMKSAYTREGDSVTAEFELVLARTRFETAEFPELRKLWSTFGSVSGWGLPLGE